MRKVFVMIAFSAVFAACGGSDTAAPEGKNDTAKTEAAKPAVDQAELDAGLAMIGALDCTTCHKLTEKNLGPGYNEVAAKYEPTQANIDSLSIKIIKGGSGVWGPTPMIAHPTLSMDSARIMVKYILSMRGKQ
jgi:cytochrome c